jgi:hypothetical protein
MTRLPGRALDATEWIPTGPAAHGRSAWRLMWLGPPALTGGVALMGAGPAGAVSAAVATAGALYLAARLQGRLALRSVGAVRIQADGAPRLRNIVEGLADASGSRVPSLWLMPEGGPNALVCHSGGPAIAVTSSLLDGYTRTELEAVVAHCLVRLSGRGGPSRAVALGTKSVPCMSFSEDAAAAAMTRYPPALASAIAKAEPAPGRSGARWFVGDRPLQESQSARREMVLDL